MLKLIMDKILPQSLLVQQQFQEQVLALGAAKSGEFDDRD